MLCFFCCKICFLFRYFAKNFRTGHQEFMGRFERKAFVNKEFRSAVVKLL